MTAHGHRAQRQGVPDNADSQRPVGGPSAGALIWPAGTPRPVPTRSRAHRRRPRGPGRACRAERIDRKRAEQGHRRLLKEDDDNAHTVAQIGYIALPPNRFADAEGFPQAGRGAGARRVLPLPDEVAYHGIAESVRIGDIEIHNAPVDWNKAFAAHHEAAPVWLIGEAGYQINYVA